MKTLMRYMTILMAIAVVSGSALASDVSTEKKAEFKKLVIQRNQLYKQLLGLDKKAAELVKQDKDITRVNGEQVTIQDRLDLIQLRLETMSARYDLDIPDLPSVKDQQESAIAAKNYGLDAFERGKTRTMLEIKRQTFNLLKSLDYSIILSRLEEN
jgi:hypothetical protein